MTPPPLLEVEDLNVWFDLPKGGTLHAVQGVSFSVPAGGRLGVVGESGCGKTTTILALMGLLPPTASVSGRAAAPGGAALRAILVALDMALAAPVATLAEALSEAQIQAVAITNPRRLFGLD